MATPLYNHSTVNGDSWQRASRIVIENTLNTLPVMQFVEEMVTVLSDGTVLRKELGVLGSVTFDPANPNHQQLGAILEQEYFQYKSGGQP